MNHISLCLRSLLINRLNIHSQHTSSFSGQNTKPIKTSFTQ